MNRDELHLDYKKMMKKILMQFALDGSSEGIFVATTSLRQLQNYIDEWVERHFIKEPHPDWEPEEKYPG